MPRLVKKNIDSSLLEVNNLSYFWEKGKQFVHIKYPFIHNDTCLMNKDRAERWKIGSK